MRPCTGATALGSTAYTTPKAGRYHEGIKAGQFSQAGFILTMLVRSLIDHDGYNHEDFCQRLDNEFLPLLDGTPVSEPGGYTSQTVRQAHGPC